MIPMAPKIIIPVLCFSTGLFGQTMTPSMQAQEKAVTEKIVGGYHLRSLVVDVIGKSSNGVYAFKLHVCNDHFVDKIFFDQYKHEEGSWLTFDEANVSDKPERRMASPHSFVLEYVINDNKSLFHVVPRDVGDPIGANFTTGEDGIGYRVYDRDGKLLGGEFFRNPQEPEATLETIPDGKFRLHVSGSSNGVMVQWSLDHGKTWSDKTVHPLGLPDYATTRIPKHVLATDQEILLEFDIMVGMKMFRKRFVYNGDGKPLKGNFASRPLRKSWQPTKEQSHRSDGWQDFEKPVANPN
jgi:hypothetical protein